MIRWTLRITILGVAAVLAASVPAAGAAQKQRKPSRTPPDSFLWQRVNSVPEFIAQVQGNPAIRKRMAKHFKVSEKDLVGYLQRNLTVVTVGKGGRYPVWGVTRNGRIYRSSTYYRKGWRAFGLRNGTALFKWSCGNPMLARLPAVPVPVARVTRVTPVIAMPPPPADTAETVEVVVQEPQELIQASPMYVAVTPQPAQPATPVSEHRSLPAWVLLPLFLGNGGGVIPEPGTILLLATGGGLLAVLRRRKP